ncbi:hypothetical protein C7212DRAFT_214849 [Tuber magnatum]|uniref:Uncharacterized protein n=1 Tax=Tuber magnatum TaxID=42249 RepID=A0A317SHK2_9PEZI|nr:hypothetical protein C7212DRAFT_214849 [Tuber magnatum]
MANQETANYDHASLLPLSTIPRRKASRPQRVLRNLVHPLRSRQERKARKLDKVQRESAERQANIEAFLEGGRIYYEKQRAMSQKYEY